MLAIAVGTTVLISREKTADYGRVEYDAGLSRLIVVQVAKNKQTEEKRPPQKCC
jgi:hypothetical protein